MATLKVHICFLLYGAVYSAIFNPASVLGTSSEGKSDLTPLETELNGTRVELNEEEKSNEETTEDLNEKVSDSVLKTRGWDDDWGGFVINNSGPSFGNGNGAVIFVSLNGGFSTSSGKKNKDKSTNPSGFVINNTGETKVNGKNSITVSPSRGSGLGKGWKGLINNSGLSVGHGNGAVIFGSPTDSSSFPSFKENKDKSDGGSINLESLTEGFRTSSSYGNHIRLNSTGVQATVVSPNRPQRILVRSGRVLVNGRVVCQNVQRLKPESTYQKCRDGSMWYTNLSVGQPMTEDEVQKFQEEDKKMEEAAKKEKEPTPQVTEEAPRQAADQATKAMDLFSSLFKNHRASDMF